MAGATMSGPTITLDRIVHSGAYTAWWTDATGHLCHRTYYGYTKRVALARARSDASDTDGVK